MPSGDVLTFAVCTATFGDDDSIQSECESRSLQLELKLSVTI